MDEVFNIMTCSQTSNWLFQALRFEQVFWSANCDYLHVNVHLLDCELDALRHFSLAYNEVEVRLVFDNLAIENAT